MGRIRRVVVVKNNMLLLLAALDDFGGSGLKFTLDLVDQWDDKGRNDGEDKNGKLLLQLLNNLGKNRYVLNGRADALHDAIVEFNDGHDLPKDILDIDGELFGILWRNWDSFLLGGRRIGLKLVELFTLITISQDSRGEFAEESLE